MSSLSREPQKLTKLFGSYLHATKLVLHPNEKNCGTLRNGKTKQVTLARHIKYNLPLFYLSNMGQKRTAFVGDT